MGVLVNRVDGVGEVVVPSVIRRDPVVIAVSTMGESPALSKFLRMRLEGVLDERYADMARLLGEMRGVLRERVSEQAERRRILWEIISDEEVWRLLEVSYEKAYKRAGEHLLSDERDSLDAGDPQESLHRRD
jgi:precorrin-2 dehydrogenase/sirohydrochlorin ferrochelatase